MFLLNRIFSSIIALTVFLFIGACDNTSMSKKQICKYVIENKTELESALNDYALHNDDGDIAVSDLNIPDYHKIRECSAKFYTGLDFKKPFKIFEFDCGGKGMGSETSYWGFYYVVSDYSLDPNEIILNAGRGYSFLGYTTIEFVKEDNGWIWRQEEGDNIVYIENITGNFYYWLEEF